MRQCFLAALLAAIIAASFRESMAMPTSAPRLHLATNEYSWVVFFAREGRNFAGSLDAGLSEVASCGLDGFEPSVNSPEDADRMGAALKAHGLAMRSLYVNTSLHEPAEARRSIENVLAIARRARNYGARIIVTNPNPIAWGGGQDKTDAQLIAQAEALNTLGKALHGLGMQLAYHNHDMEMRCAAREFHHMMTGTDPKYVKLCLDAHWVYRGAGNSQVALFDIVEHYGKRIVELHLRQSVGNVWAEVFGDGDIDYRRLAATLARMHVRPHLVLEQAVEAGTPNTMTCAEAHRRSAATAREVFAGMATE